MRTGKPYALMTLTALILVLVIGAGSAMAQVNTYLQNGERYLSEGNWAAAVNEFRYALNYEPHNTAAWYGLGRAYEGQSGAKAAYDLKVEALTGIADGASWEMTTEVASYLNEAVKAYTNAVTYYPSNSSAISPLARAQYMLGSTQDALLTLERALNPYQMNLDVMAHMLQIALFSGDAQRVVYYSQLANANQLAMADPAVVHALAAAQYGKGDYKAAEALLTPLMYRYSIGYIPFKAMGDCLLSQGRPIEALDFYNYATSIDDKAAGAWLMYADIVSLTGDPGSAAAAYKSALAANPSSFWAKLGLARSLAESRDFNGGLAMLTELLEFGSADNLDSVYAYKAMLERAAGQLQQAELSLKSALVINSANTVASAMLNTVQSEMRSKGLSSLQFDGVTIPAFEGFVINGGLAVTNSREVLLNVNTPANYVAFKNENSDYSSMNFKFGNTASYEWLLSEGDGKKSVQMRTKDGLFSAAKDGPARSIALDSFAPVITNRQAQPSSGNVFIMKLDAADAATGIGSFWLTTDGADWKYYRWIGGTFPFSLTSLSANRLVSGFVLDRAGNFAPFQVDMGSVLSGPAITNVTAQETGTGQVTVKWNTDRLANSYVEYWLGQSAYTAGAPTSTRTHSVDITGLIQGQTYQFKPISTDIYGLKSEGQPVSLTITAPPQGPTISGINVYGITSDSATLTWGTNVLSYGYVVYSAGGQQFSSRQVGPLMSAQVSLTGLSPMTVYQYQIVVWDTAGRQSYSEPRTFTTLSAQVFDKTPPRITWVAAQAGIDRADVTWDTDENADSWVMYGLSTFSLTGTMGQSDSTRSHKVALTGLMPSTTYYYKVISRDASGNSAESSVGTFRTGAAAPTDTTPPTGSININDGSQYTRSRYVYLNLYASDNATQQSALQYRIGEGAGTYNIVWGNWQQFAQKPQYLMSAGDGQRNIWVTYKDAAGNVSQPYGASIVLDGTAPGITGLQAYNVATTSAVIGFNTNELSFGSVEYGTASYSLSLYEGDSEAKSSAVSTVAPSSVIITPNPVASRPGTTSFNISLTGLRTGTTYYFRAVATDLAGNTSVSQVGSFQTQVPMPADTSAPTGNININDGSNYTRSRYVYLNLYASDNVTQQSALQFRVGEGTNSFNVVWGNWQQFASRVTYVMAAGEGQRNIWVTYKDAAGNVSQPYVASVILDTRAPSITGLQAYNITTVSAIVGFNTNEPAFGSVEYGTATYSLSLVSGETDVRSAAASSVEPSSVVITPNPAAARPGTTSFNVSITGLKANTTYYYRAVAQDIAGNVAVSQVYSFKTEAPAPADTQAPTGSILINDGSNYTRSRYVYLNLQASDNMTQQAALQFRVGEGANSYNISWGNWQQFASRVTYILTAGDGQKNVWVAFKDAAGNTSQSYFDSIMLDTKAPAISNLTATSITQISAVIGFNTDEAAYGSVEYGTAQYSLSQASGESDVKSSAVSTVAPSSVIITPNPAASRPGNTSFNISLTGLRPGTTYYFRAVAQDLVGNTAVSQVFSFTTQAAAPADTAPPGGSISINDGTTHTRSRYIYLTLFAQDNVTPQASLQFRVGEGTSAANIAWGSWQQFAAKVAYTMNAGDGQRNIWVSYKDAAGNTSQPYVASIILDTKAPVINNLVAGMITQSSAIISWNTNEPAFGSVEFGASPSSLNSVSGDASVRSAAVSSVQPSSVIITPQTVSSKMGNTSFSLNITGLAANTTYYYRAVAMDLAGNVTASQTASFRTAAVSAPPVVTPPVVTPPVVTPPVVTPPVVTPPSSSTTAVNLAGKSQGAKADASSQNEAYIAAFANDESTKTFWESGSTPDESGSERLIINFGKTVTFNAVVLRVTSDGYPKAFRIMAVLNGKWTKVAEFGDGKSKGPNDVMETITVTMNPVTTSNIRIEFLEAAKKNDRIRVYELEVYNK